MVTEDKIGGDDVKAVADAASETVASAYIHREPGVTLSNGSLGQLRNAANLGGYTIVKVVTGWGIDGGWTDYNMTEVLKLTQFTIIRTVTGDKTMLNADDVIREIRPWYDRRFVKPFWSEGNPKRTLLVEIGNEPNKGHDNPNVLGFETTKDREGRLVPTTDQQKYDFIWGYKWHLDKAIDRLWAEYPEVGIVATSLAPVPPWYPGELHKWIDRWLSIMAPTLARVGFIALHVYSDQSWYAPDDTMSFMIPKYTNLFGPNGTVARNKPLLLTEYGLASTSLDPWSKGARNAGMMHFAESKPVLPANVWGGCVFHLVGNEKDPVTGRRIRGSGPFDVYYPDGDWQYRQRINVGVNQAADRSD